MARSVCIVPLLVVLLLVQARGPVRGAENAAERKNVLIIGRSSLAGLHEVVGAMLESGGSPMNVDEGPFGARTLERMLGERKKWDYVVMDAWQFRRGATDAPEFGEAVAAFVKQVRGHSPECRIILFPWWLPEAKATNADVMRVFERCVEAARENGVWVATTGPAFMEARLARRDLRITVSEEDAHPGVHGTYINACSLVAMLTGESPVGLPATLKIRGRDRAVAAEHAEYLQELAWRVYQRELRRTRPERVAE